jgi:hypothetical protein
MNSLIIYEILKKYNEKPYYSNDDYISINDDRMGRIVSFKLYEKDGEIMVDFKEGSKLFPLMKLDHNRYITDKITSIKDFEKKWYEYYNFLKYN